MEWRGVTNAVSFERATGVTLKTPGTRAAALFTRWYCSIAFYKQQTGQSHTVGGLKYRGELVDSNMIVSVYLTREWIYNSVRWPLLRCDNFLRVLFIFRVLIATRTEYLYLLLLKKIVSPEHVSNANYSWVVFFLDLNMNQKII